MYLYYPFYPQTGYPYTGDYQQENWRFTIPQPSGAQLPAFPTAPTPPVTAVAPAPVTAEESYVENILRMNRGKIATIYMTFENNTMWNAKIFRGIIETAGRDHIIISDPETGKRYILLMVNLDYITFDEPIEYIPPALPPGITAS